MIRYNWETKVGVWRLISFWYIFEAVCGNTLVITDYKLEFPYIHFHGYENLR